MNVNNSAFKNRLTLLFIVKCVILCFLNINIQTVCVTAAAQGSVQPKDILAHVGESVSLPCHVDRKQCGSLHSVKWYKDMSRIYVLSHAGSITRAEGDAMNRSTREAYGKCYWMCRNEEANNIFAVKGRVTSEHKIKKENYNGMLIARVTVNEETDEVTECKCLDCAASAGECKHAVAFLVLDLQKKLRSPPLLSKCAIGKKVALSKAANEMKYMTLDDLVDQTVPHLVPKQSVC